MKKDYRRTIMGKMFNLINENAELIKENTALKQCKGDDDV